MTDKAKAFFGACAEGRLLEVQEALREASDAQTHTLLDQEVHFKPDGFPIELKLKPLHVAALGGHGEVVKLLVDKGANLHAQDENGWTALHLAARQGHGEVVKLLVEKGANLHAQDKKGGTPLQRAAEGGHGEVVKLLVDGGANLEAQDEDEQTALHRAADKGHGEVVKLLVDGGANLEGQDEAGRTALHLAAWGGHGEVVKLLVDKGANLEAQEEDGQTALHWAAERGHGEVVKLLVDKGANLDAQTVDGGTPLQRAALYGHGEVVKLLVEKVGAVYDAQGTSGRTVLRTVADQPNNGALMVQLLKAIVGNKNTPPEMVFYSAAYYAHLGDNFGSLADYMFDTKRDEEVEVAKDVLLVFLILIDSISGFKFNDAQFSKLSRIFAESLQTTIIQSDYISKPLAILALLAGALGNRARQRPQVRDDLLALRSKVVQLTLAALSIPEMDEEDAALKAMGYSNEDIASGNFINMAKFASCEDALPAPFHFLVTQRAADIVAAPQLQSSLDKVFYRNRVVFQPELYSDPGFLWFFYNPFLPAEDRDALPIKNEWIFQDWRTLPRFHFLSQAFFHCLYLGSTILATCYPERFSWSKDVLIWMTVGYSVEEITQLFTNGAAARYINDPWNFLDSAFLLTFFIWLATGKDALLAVNLFVLPFRLLRYLSIFKSSGILVAVLFRMITATANFLVFYATILVGFSGMMTVFYAEKDEFESLPTSCLTFFDASLGNYDLTIFMGDDNEGDDWLGIGLLIVFLLLSTVMILNLLIAVLSEEYSQLSEHSYQQWCLMYADIVQENTVPASQFPDNLRLPPPLSLLTHISYFVLWFTKLVGQKCACYSGATSKSEAISESEDIKSPIITPVAQPDIKTEADCLQVAANKPTEPNTETDVDAGPGTKPEPDSSLDAEIGTPEPNTKTVPDKSYVAESDVTIMKWVVIFVTLLIDVTVHLVVGLPWALTSLYISGFRDIGKSFRLCTLDMAELIIVMMSLLLWLLIGIPFVSILSFVWWTPAASFEAWRTCTKTNKSVGEKESVWLESMRGAVKNCAMTEDGNETSQVLGEVAKVESQVARVESQVGELKAQVKAQGGKLEAMVAQLLEAQGLATPTPAMEESVTKEEGDGTGGLAPAGVDETKSSS